MYAIANLRGQEKILNYDIEYKQKRFNILNNREWKKYLHKDNVKLNIMDESINWQKKNHRKRS